MDRFDKARKRTDGTPSLGDVSRATSDLRANLSAVGIRRHVKSILARLDDTRPKTSGETVSAGIPSLH